jgi:SAM-dependent methyltransferase
MMRVLADTLPLSGPVVELGSYRTEGEGQDELADLRSLFPGTEYVGCDLRPGPGVDRIEDMESLRFEDGSVSTLLSVDALEHVRRPWIAAREAHRVLRPDGTAVFVTCLDFKIHAHPDDYWRFTARGLDVLFDPFPVRFLGSQGAADFPHTVFAVLFKSPPARGARPLFEEVRARLEGECRLPVPWTRRMRHRAGELLVSKRVFRRLRRAQEIRMELREPDAATPR